MLKVASKSLHCFICEFPLLCFPPSLPSHSRRRYPAVDGSRRRHSTYSSGNAEAAALQVAARHWLGSPLAVGQPVLSLDSTFRHDKSGESGSPKVLTLQPSVPVIKSGQYGKWQRLSLMPQRLAYEADVLSSATKQIRLVDLDENKNDIDLWACLLNARQRKDGSAGVAAIFEGVCQRRALRQVHGVVAEGFWRTILEEAVQSEAAMMDVWDYAAWLWEKHNLYWPNLYATSLHYFVANKQVRRAIRWHIRLSAHFGVYQATFISLLRAFIADPDSITQDILCALYTMSVHRRLYDEIVPYLYWQGRSQLAKQWRVRFLNRGDLPVSFAARPFLRFLAGYEPQLPMVEQEYIAAGLRETAYVSHDQQRSCHFRQLMDRVHDESCSLEAGTYNDELGARWFASSWISVDLAIDLARSRGIKQIGPRSLQSIARREEHPDRILDRIEQLEMALGLGQSNYVRAVRHFAAAHDSESLADLLHLDLHLDVLEDEEKQERIIRSARAAEDWKTCRLIMAVRLAVSLDAVALFSNRLLVGCLGSTNKAVIVKILDDMTARGVQMFPFTSHRFSMHIIEYMQRHRQGRERLGFYASVCQRINAMQFPLTSEALRAVFLALGRDGQLDVFERLALETAKRYKDMQTQEQPTLNIHKHDVPAMAQQDSDCRSFQIMPRDLRLGHHLHPLQQIFDTGMKREIIRWGFLDFINKLSPRRAIKGDPRTPEDFGFARGIRLLAMLGQLGVHVPPYSVRGSVTHRLAELYSDWGIVVERPYFLRQNLLSLEEARALCNEAWGGEVLPPLRQLMVEMRRATDRLRWQKLILKHPRKRMKPSPISGQSQHGSPERLTEALSLEHDHVMAKQRETTIGRPA